MRLSLAALMLSALPALADTPIPFAVTDGDYVTVDMDKVALGRLLFWDTVISGNRNTSCATCHHPRFGTSDGQSLSLGEGGIGLGPDRVADPLNLPEQRIPRNSPSLWNLGAKEFTVMFHDGRIEDDPTRPGGLRSPLEDDMVSGFASLLSAQNMFPVLSPDEMAGHYDENEISVAVRQGVITAPGGAWDRIAARVEGIPEYRAMFDLAAPETKGRALQFADISNQIAEFVAFEFRSDDTPFDAYLRGTGDLLPQERAGMDLFYGKAGCADCHMGKFQTDHGFHAMGEPQVGPGKAERFERHQRDTGRMRVTNAKADAYAFRTPSLRNITLTGPYGHAGAHSDLAAYLAFHLDPVAGLKTYVPQATLAPLDGARADWALRDGGEEYTAIAAAVTRAPVVLSAAEQAEILAFLTTLKSPAARSGRLGIPAVVPSGLVVEK
jgi:cytochrome c peroxidase